MKILDQLWVNLTGRSRFCSDLHSIGAPSPSTDAWSVLKEAFYMYLGWLSSGPPSSSWSGPGAGTVTHSAKASFFSCHGCLGSNLMHRGYERKSLTLHMFDNGPAIWAVHKKIQEQNQAGQLLDNTAKCTSHLPVMNKNQ